ncbi:MAG: ribbon-helix-helix protein, CopG family [Pseudolysinimonas sp.]
MTVRRIAEPEFATTAISIRLSPDDEERLGVPAAKTRRSKTFHVREAIHEHLDDLGERY